MQESSDSTEEGSSGLMWQFVGIGTLLFALVMSAVLGIFQETLYAKFGKYPREAMFYSVSRSVVPAWVDGVNWWT